MKLIDTKVKEYLDVLKSDAPAPGGGSVSALAGAQGMALVMMVCDLTIGKEKFADFQADCINGKEKALKLYEALVEGIDKDTEAFNLVSAAYKLPKDTDEEKKARSAAIAEGTLEATKVPFETMGLGLEGMKTVVTLIGKSNPNASSDLGVAILNLTSCIEGAWLNVKINLSGIKDESLKKEFEKNGKKIIEEAKKIAEPAFKEIESSL